MAIPEPGPPPGWTAINGKVVPAETIGGYAARQQAVKGVCRARDCRRTVELDPVALCAAGQGFLQMSQVQALWRCNRLERCNLQFHNEKPFNPLLLGQFVGKPNVRVQIRCQAGKCTFYRHWRVEEMIDGLKKRRQGNDRTEVEALRSKMTMPCPVCKKVDWTADILWINTGAMGWKALGERSFEPRETG